MNESYVKKIVESGKRLEEREFDKLRELKIEKGYIKSAEGSARVILGNTEVIVGVKLSVGTPFPDTPDQGILIVNAEFAAISSEKFEPGPPRAPAVEAARVIDRGIRESKCIDLDKLCIIPKEKVWLINIDVQVVNHDGNLIDAGAIGAIAALSNAKMLKYVDEKIVREEDGPLPLRDQPIAITTGKIGGKLLLDPNFEEEEALDARLTVTTNKDGNICALQKGGNGWFTTEETERAVDWSIEKGREIRGMIH